MIRQSKTIVVDVGVDKVLKMSGKSVFYFLCVLKNAKDFAIAIPKIIIANDIVSGMCRLTTIEDKCGLFRN